MASPPAYTATAPAYSGPITPLPVSTGPPPGSIQDTRALILANAALLRPRKMARNWNHDLPLDLVIARHTPPRPSAEDLPREQHRAILIHRKPGEAGIDMVLEGEPRDSIQECLEHLLRITEGIVEGMLVRHGRTSDGLGCCVECHRALKVGRPGRVGQGGLGRR
ncbi:hypothetical protein Tdes44962_MAKER08937 [Teratosphaeria destructans]|uniref:Uncharacterized protein n=1 Tax=Teratosphaeria destructans TaxID=418781 RepID=A0A9W7SV01_9PEZI|nr:hypothetical protein Tdes44962_MAKER08937 [Teratosphaeria destructans]